LVRVLKSFHLRDGPINVAIYLPNRDLAHIRDHDPSRDPSRAYENEYGISGSKGSCTAFLAFLQLHLFPHLILFF
jgi:hypothetical protein